MREVAEGAVDEIQSRVLHHHQFRARDRIVVERHQQLLAPGCIAIAGYRDFTAGGVVGENAGAGAGDVDEERIFIRIIAVDLYDRGAGAARRGGKFDGEGGGGGRSQCGGSGCCHDEIVRIARDGFGYRDATQVCASGIGNRESLSVAHGACADASEGGAADAALPLGACDAAAVKNRDLRHRYAGPEQCVIHGWATHDTDKTFVRQERGGAHCGWLIVGSDCVVAELAEVVVSP